MDIRAEAQNQWALAFADACRPNLYRNDFVKTIANREREAEAIVATNLQPWLHIFEDSIQWLAGLTTILDRLNDNNLLDSAGRTIWALVGSCCAHAMAVRRLVLSGLDPPARAEARSLDEHLCACIAFLHDRELAKRFQQCQSEKETSQFWYKHLSTKILAKHLNAVERAVGVDANISEDMRAWRANEISCFSQAIHPSYIGAAFSTHTICAANPDSLGPSFLGMASVCSERTLNFACKSIWYFACFGFMMIFNEYKSQPPIIVLDKEDKIHQLVVCGRDVIRNLNKKYWSHEIYGLTEG